jgi:hypothetical protein
LRVEKKTNSAFVIRARIYRLSGEDLFVVGKRLQIGFFVFTRLEYRPKNTCNNKIDTKPSTTTSTLM